MKSATTSAPALHLGTVILFLQKRINQLIANGWSGMMTRSQHVYEVRPRKDHRGVDLTSDVLGFSVRPISSIEYRVHVLPFSLHVRQRESRHCARSLGRL